MASYPLEKKDDKKAKKPGRAKRFFTAVFVHNFWGKLACLLISAAMWALAVGLA